MESMWSPALSIAISSGLTGLVIVLFVYLKDFFTNRSLKTTLENIRLNAEIAAADMASTKLTQEAIHVAVNSQQDLLRKEIAELRAEVKASNLAEANEKDKAKVLAVQAAKDKADADARLLAARQATALLPPADPDGNKKGG